MKTKEELLKIYSAYLPYGLTAETVLNTKFTFKGLSFRHVLQDEKGFDMGQIGTTKLHLYSMDMLTKEIEHKGESFIPLIRLAKLVDNGHNSESKIKQFSGLNFLIYTDKCDDVENVKIRFSNVFSIERLSQNVLASTVLKIQNLLIEWHFNVFGLDESEYISKK